MNGREVELLLRRWYRDEVGEDRVASHALRRRVGAIALSPSTRSAAGDRRLLLVAAALVVSAVMLAMLAAAGRDLLRIRTAVDSTSAPPISTPSPAPVATPSPEASFTASPAPTLLAIAGATVESEPLPGRCARGLDDGALMTLTSDQTELVVMNDRRVLTGKAGVLALNDEWRQRTLSPAGLEQLLAAIDGAELPSCLSDPAGADQTLVLARPGKSVMTVSSGTPGYRKPTDTESRAIQDLLARISDLDELIPPTGWQEPAWQPYGLVWELAIWFDPGRYGQCPGGGPCLRSGVGVELPGGTDLRTFGETYNTGENVDARCGAVDNAQARELVERLDLDLDYSRDFWIDGAVYTVRLFGQLPHEPLCEGPARRSLDPPDGALPMLDPCRLIGEVREMRDPYLGRRHGLATEDWAFCSLYMHNGDLDIFMRSRPTTSAEADSFVRSLFGGGNVTFERFDGGTTYKNVCPSALMCRPTLALGVEPYFFVMTYLNSPDDAWTDLVMLADGIVRSLAEQP